MLGNGDVLLVGGVSPKSRRDLPRQYTVFSSVEEYDPSALAHLAP
jgi:hypothetical protein